MSGIRKIWFFSLLVVAALFVCSASAAYYLPDSSHEDGAWEGSSIHRENDFNVCIDFAVCDTEALQFANETELSDQFDIADQYFYISAIFKRGDYIHDETIYPGILDTGGQRIDEALLKSNTGCHSDCSRVGAPARQHRNTQRLWVRIHDAVPIY